jgi:putative ABC transport system permease protein
VVSIPLPLRNLLRNRRRSLATLLAMAIGAASILLFGGYSANIQLSMQTAYICTGGHLQIQHRDYFLYGSGNPTAYGIDNVRGLLDAIARDPALKGQVRVATPTLQFGGIAGNYAASVSRTVVGLGLQADDVQSMREWNEYKLPLTLPAFALVGAPADAAIVGKGVARVLKLCEALGLTDCSGPTEDPIPAAEPPVPDAKGAKGAKGVKDVKGATAAKGKALPSDIAQLADLEGKSSDSARGAGRAGARLELLASSPTGTPNVTALQVVKAENQGFKELDEVLVTMHLEQAQRLIYGRGTPRATSVIVQLERTAQVAPVKQRLEEMLPTLGLRQPLAVLDYEQLNPFYVQTVQLFNTIFGFIFALIGGIVLFTVSNTMNTAVVERTVEIGTLRAIGLRRSGILRMFVMEGLLLGLTGAMVGAVAAIVIAAAINAAGLTWLPPGSAEPLPLIIRVWGQTAMIAGTTIGLVLVAAISAWWPARQAARLNVVEALRHA